MNTPHQPPDPMTGSQADGPHEHPPAARVPAPRPGATGYLLRGGHLRRVDAVTPAQPVDLFERLATLPPVQAGDGDE